MLKSHPLILDFLTTENRNGNYEFDYSKILVNERMIPIATYSSKLIVYPSRFVFYSIKENDWTTKVACKNLKILVQLIQYQCAKRVLNSLTPDELICSATIHELSGFIFSNRKTRRNLITRILREFYLWVTMEEGVSIDKALNVYLSNAL